MQLLELPDQFLQELLEQTDRVMLHLLQHRSLIQTYCLHFNVDLQ
ncbi:hypothetical protein K013_2631 [Acinetobacter baumannii 25569_7]|nr:hypothetical protein K013_2631 [Acinetobacter baumannii 25569_7]